MSGCRRASSSSCGFPASGRRRPRGSGASSASRRSTACRPPPRRAGCASSRGWVSAARRRSSPRSWPEPAASRRAKSGGCSAPGSRRSRPSVAELSEHPAAIAVSEAGSVRRRRETVRDLDIIATSDRRARAHRGVLRGAVGRRGRGAEETRRRRSSATRGFASTFASCRPSATATCSSTSPARRTTTSLSARTRNGEGSRSRSTASRTSRPSEVVTHASEEELYAYLGYDYIPPELRENSGELALARDDALPALVELGDLRGEMHCHSTWSADGKNTIEEMARAAKARGYRYLCLTDHSHYLRDGQARAAVEGDREGQRPREAVPGPARDRGQHHAPTGRSTSRTRSSPSSTGSSRRCTRRSTAIRPSGSSGRWTTRTSTASATSRGGAS